MTSYPYTDYRTFGVPTVRSDRPAPRVRRVSDHTVSQQYQSNQFDKYL